MCDLTNPSRESDNEGAWQADERERQERWDRDLALELLEQDLERQEESERQLSE
jgi:hypothetical protein